MSIKQYIYNALNFTKLEIKLKVPCPVCVEEGTFDKDINWRHTTGVCAGSGGHLIVNQDAMVSCDDPDCKTTWYITSANWFCPEHMQQANHLESKGTSNRMKIEILRNSSSHMKQEGSQQFFDNLLRSL